MKTVRAFYPVATKGGTVPERGETDSGARDLSRSSGGQVKPKGSSTVASLVVRFIRSA